MESCHSDRIVIKPQRLDLPLDVVLFDCNGNFIGPVSELLGDSISSRYIVRVEEDASFRMKRNKLKVGDFVYYYNCDRLHNLRGHEEMKNELGLLAMKKSNRESKKKHSNSSKIRRSIMDGVIENLRELKVEFKRSELDQQIEEELKSCSKNSKSIASIVLNSYCNINLGSKLEKQKAKKYKKIKARILGNLGKPKEAITQSGPAQNDNRIENELHLGKRRQNFKLSKRDSLFNTSTDYSKNSHDADRKGDSLLGKKTPSDNHMYLACMLEEDPLFDIPGPQMIQEDYTLAINAECQDELLRFSQD